MTRFYVVFLAGAIGLSFPPRARALTLDGAFAAKLMRARRPRDVARLRAEFDRLREAKLACTIQIARRSAPVECYEVLRIERAWKILTEPRVRAKRRRLDAACFSAALRLDVPEAAGSLAHVSRECMLRVEDARSTRRYRRADSAWSGD